MGISLKTSMGKCLVWAALAQMALLAAEVQAVVVWNDWTAGNEVQFVREQEGYLYAGTPGGLVTWDLPSRCYEKNDERDGLQYSNVTCAIRAPDGAVWVGITGAVAELRGGTARTRLNLQGWFDYVSDMEFDRRGRLWVATMQEGGLYCYDGQSLIREDFGLASPWTPSVAVGNDGSVWVVAGQDGLMRFVGEEWQHYPLPAIPPLSDSLISYALDVEIDEDGVVWTTVQYRPDVYRAEHCLCRLEDDSWGVFLIQPEGAYPSDIAVDQAGRVWLALGVGLAMFDGGRWQYWSTLDGHSLRALTSVSASADGTGIWVARGNKGILRIEEGSVEPWLTDDPTTRSHRCPLALEGDKLWVGMDHASLASYDRGRWESVRLLPEDASLAPDVTDLAVGPDGMKWVCCPGVGLIRFDGKTTAIYDRSNSPLESYEGPVMVSQDEVVWLSDSRGLRRFDGQSWELFSSENEFPLSEVFAMDQARDGPLWFGGAPGACSFDGSVFKAYNAPDGGVTGSYVTGIACAPDGRVYFGSYNLLARFDGNDWVAYTCDDFGMMPGWIWAVTASDDGALWLGNGFEGLRRFDGMNCLAYSSSNSPLVSDQVDSVIKASHGLWISTGGGISFRQEVEGMIQLSLSANTERGASETEEPPWSQYLSVRARCVNGIGAVWGDVYLWVECPDGSHYFLPSLSTEPKRLARKVHFTEDLNVRDAPIFSCDTNSVPAGRYVFKLIIMNRNSTTEPLSNIASCEWNFIK